MTQNAEFDYLTAFSRNLGWLSLSEQQSLKTKTVAIAGLGGVGGGHLLALARLGVEQFHIADLDVFDLANMNRQAGCMMSSLGQSKVLAMQRQAWDINPNIRFTLFEQGVNERNIFDFLLNVDLVVDGLDLYAPKIRRLVFARAYEWGVPVVTAGPLGGGTACLVFNERSPHPDRYFDFRDDHTDMELLVRFLIGLAPKALQSQYLTAPIHVSPLDKKVCSLSAGSYFATGMITIKALQILLERGDVFAAPNYQQYDGYLNRFVTGKLRWGNRSPWQRLKAKLVMAAFKKMQTGFVPISIKENESVKKAKA